MRSKDRREERKFSAQKAIHQYFKSQLKNVGENLWLKKQVKQRKAQPWKQKWRRSVKGSVEPFQIQQQ